MQNIDPFASPQNTNKKEDLKVYIDKLFANKYLFIISVILCVGLAYVYAKFARPEYSIKGKILVKEDKGNSSATGKSLSDIDLMSLLGTPGNIDAELEIINSRALMTNVVSKLHLNITTGLKGKFRALESSDRFLPFEPTLVSQVDTISPRKYTITRLSTKNFHISNAKEGVDLTGTFGQPVKLPQYYLLLTFKEGYILPPNVSYEITIQSVDSKVEELMGSFSAELANKTSPIINLSLNYPVPDKGEKILQTLMDLYLKKNLQDKVRIADSTLAFIDEQLAGVTKDLGGVENRIQSFKTRNQLADIDEQSKTLISNESDNSKKLNDIEVQLTLVNEISNFLNNPANHRIIPSSLTIQDPAFAAAISTYNQLITERDRQSLSYASDHPIIINLNQQIESAREGLLKSFNEYRRTLDLSRSAFATRNNSISSQISSVPTKEREFQDISRQQTVKQQLYVYLLEKRDEAAISKTSTFSSSEIVDPAKSGSLPYAPKKAVIYLLGLMAGCLLPIVYLGLKEGLNSRILTKTHLTSATQVPIVGEINHNPDNRSLVTSSYSRSLISEQFKNLRTNLKFMFKSEQPQVIMITSSMSGEGKSFISLNLGSALAVTGKKVVILEFDLRRPKLSLSMGIDDSTGYTNWVISDSEDVEEIIKPVPERENVYILSSGLVPPNPAELLENAKMRPLMEELKKRFDFIVMDTAPVGLVSDALLVEKYADMTLYIVRQGYTYKSQLALVNDLAESGKIRKLYLVVNDIDHTDRGGYNSYGYGYGYGEGYGGYIVESEKKGSVFSRMFKS